MPDVICPKCGNDMKLGFVTAIRGGGLDNSYTQPELWVAGQADPSFWTGPKVRDKEHHTLVAYRCARCGFVEFYAPAAER